MDFSWLVPLLAMGTLLAVLVFALTSKAAVEDRMDDPAVPKSTLAKDGPFGGVGFLMPIDRTVHENPYVRPVME